MEKTIIEGRISIAWLVCRMCIDFLATCILVGFWWIPRDIIRYSKTKLTITNKRAYGHTGLVNTEDLDSPLDKITGVKVDQGAMGKIFNYGTVSITTAANVFAFDALANPHDIRAKIMEYVQKSEEDKEDRLAKKIAQAHKK